MRKSGMSYKYVLRSREPPPVNELCGNGEIDEERPVIPRRLRDAQQAVTMTMPALRMFCSCQARVRSSAPLFTEITECIPEADGLSVMLMAVPQT